MEDPEIKKLLQAQGGQEERRGWGCPDEIQLASYVTQSLSTSERDSIEAHIADCGFCLNQVAFLTESAAWRNSEEVPPKLLSEARKLVSPKPGKFTNWRWRWAAASAAFAGLIFLVGVVVLQRRGQESVLTPHQSLVAQTSPQPVESPRLTVESSPVRAKPTPAAQVPKAKSPQPPAIRSAPDEGLLPKLISPRNGGVIRREDLEFRWTPVTDAIFYDVRITSAEGDVVFEKQTEETTLKLGSATPLMPGTKYFATIHAHLRFGKTVRSSVVSFRLAEQ